MTQIRLPPAVQPIAGTGRVDPHWERWFGDLARAVNDNAGSGDSESVSPLKLQQGVGISITGEDIKRISLAPLADAGTGTTLKKIERDVYGRLSATEDASAVDVPYDNTTSGLTATDAQAAIDELKTLVASSGGYPEGTSNPGSPTAGDKFYRTDLNLLIVYDGTRWLTVQTYEVTPSTFDALAGSGLSGVGYARWGISSDFGIYLERLIATTYVTTTNSGTAFWTLDFKTQIGAVATSRATFNTSADSPNTDTKHDQTLSLAFAAGAISSAIAVCTKTGAPGGIYPQLALRYRLIVT